MKRTPVNPWDWSKQYQFNQAEIVEGVSRHLVCAGQTSIGADGTRGDRGRLIKVSSVQGVPDFIAT